MERFIPLSVPNLKGNELKYVTKAVEDEWVSTGGAFISRFEEAFAAYSGTRPTEPTAASPVAPSAVDAAPSLAEPTAFFACQSGTAALHLALLDAGIGPGDLVCAPTLTFIAAVNPIRYVGAEPVFMDCDDSLCMDMEKLAAYMENECERRADGYAYDKTLARPVRAVVVVHVFGNAADMERLLSIAEAYRLIVIEDATEAVGTFYSAGKLAGKMAGTIGDYGAYSFNGNKIITTGGGGMFTARKAERARRMKHLSTQAKTDEVYYTHDEVGYNYRMTNLQAAVGLAQLEQLEGFIEIKRENYQYYREQGLALLPFREGVRSNYWLYSHMSRNRDALIRRLSEARIQTRPVWGLCHEQRMYARSRAYRIEKAAYYYARIVNIPCSTGLLREDARRVAEEISAFESERQDRL
ncbi:MAG: DegT/DnrJ/EryC1/StrS family aminotransferase [Clostridiales bacterium]|nr:DegT/DnrJ/EryC1/StrS family aminotransferase [Clostridiales bacterium]